MECGRDVWSIAGTARCSCTVVVWRMDLEWQTGINGVLDVAGSGLGGGEKIGMAEGRPPCGPVTI